MHILHTAVIFWQHMASSKGWRLKGGQSVHRKPLTAPVHIIIVDVIHRLINQGNFYCCWLEDHMVQFLHGYNRRCRKRQREREEGCLKQCNSMSNAFLVCEASLLLGRSEGRTDMSTNNSAKVPQVGQNMGYTRVKVQIKYWPTGHKIPPMFIKRASYTLLPFPHPWHHFKSTWMIYTRAHILNVDS